LVKSEVKYVLKCDLGLVSKTIGKITRKSTKSVFTLTLSDKNISFQFNRFAVSIRGIQPHNEELNDLYSLLNIVRVVKSRRMRWAGHVARMGEDRGVHRVLVRKPEGKRPFGRPRRRWDDNIKMDFQEVGGSWGLDGVGSG
jgi:hypothetical protein